MRSPECERFVPRHWRSLEEREEAERGTFGHTDEFVGGACRWPPEASRRDFIKMLGASFALAGLSGCGRAPREEIVPYIQPPGTQVSSQRLRYASAMPWEGYARGVLVDAYFGRPIKIEGNPAHPESRGATDAFTQADILSLYDPERTRAPMRQGSVESWERFDREWAGVRAQLRGRQGRGFAVLTEPTTSPTSIRLIHQFLDTMPEARWYQHTPLPRYDHRGRQWDYDFATADVVLLIGGDCFARHPAALRYAGDWAKQRRLGHGGARLSRVYMIEPTPTVTGSVADFRLPLPPPRVPTALNAIARMLVGGIRETGLSGEEAAFVEALVKDLQRPGGRGLCVPGAEQDEAVHGWAEAMNGRLGAIGTRARPLTPVRTDADGRAHGALEQLATDLERGEVEALIVLGTNPAYTAPGLLEFGRKMERARWTVHGGGFADETAERCLWHLPVHHWLEDWNDLRAYAGNASVVQPLIAPLHGSRSMAELLYSLSHDEQRSAYDLVRETWGVRDPGTEAQWKEWLNQGLIAGEREATGFSPPDRVPELPEDHATTPTLTLEPDATISDGRYAHNAWLQELPKPMTHLVWDNALLIGPAHARSLDLKNGDRVQLVAQEKELEVAVWLMPGQAERTVTLSLGYGRLRAGPGGGKYGFDGYQVRPSSQSWRVDGVQLRKTSSQYALVSTQRHFAMEGRDPVRTVSEENVGQFKPAAEETESLFAAWPRGRYAWGMVIDLSTCTGCNACVVACQAENNIPTVGKEQCGKEREMHWLRVDRYFSGAPERPRILHQPIPCMHCENAPCEVVCPVGATVHSSEGLNDMVYNRCIGTRYCSNNCPYKVRRFNFLEYNRDRDSSAYLQKNPDVTVRERGVMEKCTYCVQRIDAARIAAEKEDRRIRDGEVRTACQQACPVEAIVFGDLNDPESAVVRHKRERTHYRLLEELNTRPRTSYLARVVAQGEGTGV